MESALVKAALSVVGTALSPFKDSLLEKWAASNKLGSNVKELELELLAVQALLEHTARKEIVDNTALKRLLVRLQELGYDAEDVLDELEYFRIQDELDGTFEAADEHAKGCACDLALHLGHTAKAVGKQVVSWLACCSAAAPAGCKARLTSAGCCNRPIHGNDVGKHFPCSSLPCVRNEPPKLRFDRVAASGRMKHIVEQMRLVSGIVSSTITTLGSKSLLKVPNLAQSRPITTSEITEKKLYGRDIKMKEIIHDITEGKHSREALTVIPIVGLGGIGKTTFAQHIYHSENVQVHFKVKFWTCVSFNFNANRLIEEIKEGIPKNDGESGTGTARELLGERLKLKRFLLVLDDIWDCRNEDEWRQLLAPFKKSQVQGNIIIVTTRFRAQALMMIQKYDHSIYLEGLENIEFKKLFLDIVFGNGKSRQVDKSLLRIAEKIVDKLKGSPLAAKTVGRLLRTQVDLDHWTKVLKSKEWMDTKDGNGIMPALKLSYYYLPAQLQRCFSYCSLFPQDYKFERQELIHFWIGLDVLHSSHGGNKSVEDIGLSHLTELVNYGFFEKGRKKNGSICYIIHDLLHELAQKVSSHECLSRESSRSQVRSLQVLPSIRHLSISIDDNNVNDRLTLKNCVEDFNTLDKRLKVEQLRSLMLFGEHHGCFVKAFGDLFRKAKALRVVFLSEASYDVEDLLHNFYNLVHLRYLRIKSSPQGQTTFPNRLSRFYHMLVLDAKHCDIDNDLPRGMSNLVKLRHFLVKSNTTHSCIFNVGKLKSLQELRRFMVKQDGQGFELRNIGQLVELSGSLCIDNLENVQAMEGADEAKLMQKDSLHELILCWNSQSTIDPVLQENVLERLKPSSNLQKLSIIQHGGATCPSWLGTNPSVRSLESLCLNGVAWKTFPPIGVNEPCEEISCNIPDKMLENLTRLELVNLPWLEKWAGPCQLLPGLLELKIGNCPKLLSFPSVPWNSKVCSVEIEGIGSPCLQKLVYEAKKYYQCSLTIEGKDTPDNMCWDVLAFDNLTKLEVLTMVRCQPLQLHHMQKLSSLRELKLSCSSTAFPFVEVDSHVEYKFPVQSLGIEPWHASQEELTQLLTYFPKLSELCLSHCDKITRLGVMEQQATATPGPSSSTKEVGKAQIQKLLLLPPQLKRLCIWHCPELSLLPLDDKHGQTEGLQGLSVIQDLVFIDCPKLLSSDSSSSFSYFPFPNSLENLDLMYGVRMKTLVPLSNLRSLTSLSVFGCEGLGGKGLLSLLAQGHVTKLRAREMSNLFDRQEVPSHPSRLHELRIDGVSVSTITSSPIWSWLFSSLTTLSLEDNNVMERFTNEQEDLLLVNSLEDITFDFWIKLQVLPARLHTLPNLKRLVISWCEEIHIMPEDGLPSSLKELIIRTCPKVQSLPKNCIPCSLQRLVIVGCPAIRSLPKLDDLPSSLREIDVRESQSEELRRQCRKLIGIIPIVIA